jgi:hypothetical protein
MRADIHNGQEHERSIHGPDTEAQDQSPPLLKSGLQHTAGPYSLGHDERRLRRSRPSSGLEREHWMTHSELKPPMPIGCVRLIKTEKRPHEYGAAAKAKDCVVRHIFTPG